MFKKNLVFAAACSGMLLFGVTLITLGSVVTGLTDKFALTGVSAGTLFSILPVGILIGSLVFGPFCDKYGYKALMTLSCALIAAGFEGIAYASTFSILQLCIFLFGIGGGIINGATNAVVADISDTGKGANLSLLGVFYGIGALGMPFLLGVLQDHYNFEVITAGVGVLAMLIGLFFILIRFPPAKQVRRVSLGNSLALVKDPLLLLIAFFLFCQSSFEAIINNWTTTFLTSQLAVEKDKALYALSLLVVGMTVMRLVTGSAFRNYSVQRLLLISFILMYSGCTLFGFGPSYNLAVTGLVLLGAGLAGGFPIMLGIAGNMYRELSGTAFSFVLTIALVGNILVNYLMGVIIQTHGVQYVTVFSFLETTAMALLSYFILKRIHFSTKSN